MSHLVARILLTILMLPLAAVTYTAVFVSGLRLQIFTYPNQDIKAFVGTGVLVWILVAAYWLALWGRGVLWTSSRRNLTWLVAVASTAVSVVISFALTGMTNQSTFAAFIGSAFAPLLWLVATVFVWRESRDERAGRLSRANSDALVCPACGYNLTGLSEARCPECGARYTLNELIAQQPDRRAAGTEREIVG